MNGADYKKAIETAEKVLDDNFVSGPPVPIIELTRNFGFTIKEVSFPKNEDVSGIIKPEEKIIYVNQNDSETRKNFTIAHELGHWLLHQEALVTSNGKYNVLFRRSIGQMNADPIESEANCFAANILVPKKFITEYKLLIRDKIIDSDILAPLFRVSNEVMGYRLQYEQFK